jgi:uncharacterized protein (TIGR03118 family)
VLTAAVSTALVGAAAPAGASGGSGGHHEDRSFTQRNLVSDLEGLAEQTDPNLKNPWGIDFGPSTPLWVANQASNTSTLYRGATPAEPNVTVLPLVVKAQSPTGLVFNPTKKFVIEQGGKTAPANFLFNENLFADDDSATGEISGWSNASAPPPPTDTVVKVKKENSVYLGLALLPPTHKRGPRLLAADGFGRIAVYDGQFRPRRQSGRAFVDPNAAKDKMVPYNVEYLKGRVYVAYTPSEEGGANAISVFTKEGKFKKRLITNGPLKGPWGMAVAPKHWGGFGRALLVGNVEDGKINAFHRRSGRFLGTLENDKGEPLVNLGLWGLRFGNGVFGTPNDLIFAAGIGDEVDDPFLEVYEHGLLGIITPNDDDDDDHGGS